MMRLSSILAALCVLFGSALSMGGCSQQLAVEGRSDRLYAEAKGALLSEGFRPMGRKATVVGAQGSDPRAGRLQFLYYGDTVSPTVVEVQITASDDGTARPVAPGTKAPAMVASVGAAGPAAGSVPGSPTGTAPASAAPASASASASPAPGDPVASPVLLGAHQVIVRAWSSMTFAPDPFIADLAMGVLRRAYSLSGNAP